MSAQPTHNEADLQAPGLVSDLLTLTKFRLSFLVLTTTFTGYLLRGTVVWNSFLTVHVLMGASAAAFGAAVFNQLLEIKPDALMRRTSERPLPAGRMTPLVAFVTGLLLSLFGVLHLCMMVNLESGLLAALTLITYIFIYTPMKAVSSWNTVVGAVAGALPPLIGWTAAAGMPGPHVTSAFRCTLFFEPGAVFLFALLFFWQMPHFIAINWMYREEYERAGHVMWSGGDVSGQKSARLIFVYSLALVVVTLWPGFQGFMNHGSVAAFLLLDILLLGYAYRFFKNLTRKSARNVFLFTTVIWLPLALCLTLVGWKN